MSDILFKTDNYKKNSDLGDYIIISSKIGFSLI